MQWRTGSCSQMTAFRKQLDPKERGVKFQLYLNTTLANVQIQRTRKAAGTTFGMRWREYNKSVICSYCSAFEQRWDEINSHSGIIHSLLLKVPNSPRADVFGRTWRAHTEMESQRRDSARGLKRLGVLIWSEGRMKQQVDRCSVYRDLSVSWSTFVTSATIKSCG